MADYEAMYQILFHSITDAIEAIDKRDYHWAKKVLMNAQKKAEDIYLE